MNLKENLISAYYAYGDQFANTLPKVESFRDEAIKIFEEKGFPTRKDENWKYTNLAPLLKKDYRPFFESDTVLDYKEVKKYFIDEIESYKIVFVDGKYSSFLSETTHDGCDICILSSALKDPVYFPVIEACYNTLADNNQSLVALNTAFAKEGAYVHIPRNVQISKPIQIIHFYTKSSTEHTFNTPRNLVVLEDFAQATIIERVQHLDGASAITNMVTEIKVGKNANLDFYKIQNDKEDAQLIDSVYIEQQRDSEASMHTFSLGGKVTRNNLTFTQKGENCVSHLNGLTLIDDKQHVDHHTMVDHQTPNCESHELYKGIFDGHSKGVFNGKVYVHSEAQKINAFQQNNNILISDNCEINAKPQLEIFADDVKCSHGCTVGQLDETALFYMRSRGIPEKQAKGLLLYAFANESLENVKLPELEKRVYKLISKKLNVDLDVLK